MDYETLTTVGLLVLGMYFLLSHRQGKPQEFKKAALLDLLHQTSVLKMSLKRQKEEILSTTDSEEVLAELTKNHDQTVLLCVECFPEDGYEEFFIDV